MEKETIGLGESRLYRLPDGRFLRVCSMLDDEEYPYGYDFFGSDRRLIDGGVFGVDGEPLDWDSAMREAAACCDIPAEEAEKAVHLGVPAEYDDLEELGFTGF